jgi:Flp pilus assembly protein TadG
MGNMTHSRQQHRGLAVVEAALIMPLIVLLVLGILEYGWMFLKSYQVGNAARVAVRQAAMPDGMSDEVIAKANQLLAEAGLAGTVTLTPTLVQDALPPQTVTVEITASYVPLTNAPLLPVPNTLHAFAVFNKEGF